MHVGFDDTDSTRQGCTTYVASLLVELLEKMQVEFIDYPSLIRLNPNVPWKTRGNGALVLRFRYDPNIEDEIKEKAVSLIEFYSDLSWKGTDPGIVFLSTSDVPTEITDFARDAEKDIVTLKRAIQLIKKYHCEAIGYNSQRGIIGALAAIGETLTKDYTYEFIAYRKPENFGTKRKVSEESIFRMDRELQPLTFNNVDLEKKRVIITPRGPDPVLFGIRGESPEIVKQAFNMVEPQEPIDKWLIFRTNQGTDAHLNPLSSIDQVQPFSSVILKGTVSRNPQIFPVRHVIFAIKDETGEIDCAAYEPTGNLRKVAQQLAVGDKIEVFGAVRKPDKGKPLTINLEKINVLDLSQKTLVQNPKCPNCGKRLKSMGKNQPLRCEKCKTKFSNMERVSVSKERDLRRGLYVTSTRSQRHLTKPLRRYGLEKHGKPPALIVQWHFESSG